MTAEVADAGICNQPWAKVDALVSGDRTGTWPKLREATDMLMRAVDEAQQMEREMRAQSLNLEAQLQAARRQCSAHERALQHLTAKNQHLQAKADDLNEIVKKQDGVIKEFEARVRRLGAPLLEASGKYRRGDSKRLRLSSPVSKEGVSSTSSSNFKVPVEDDPRSPAEGAKDRFSFSWEAKPLPAIEEAEPLPMKAPTPPWRRSAEAMLHQEATKEEAQVVAIHAAPEDVKDAAQAAHGLQVWELVPIEAPAPPAEVPRGAALENLKDIPGLRIWETKPELLPIEAPPAPAPVVTRHAAPEGAEDVPGLRVWEPVPIEAPPPPLPAPDAQEFLKVRAEGRLAMKSSVRGLPCRCVVRGRDQRAALQGFDCEQCRSFHQATGVQIAAAKSWQQGPKSSRHRLEHAPTDTPPGFWDLSFPHSPK